MPTEPLPLSERIAKLAESAILHDGKRLELPAIIDAEVRPLITGLELVISACDTLPPEKVAGHARDIARITLNRAKGE